VVWWIAGGVAGLALLVLVMALLTTLGSLRRFAAAMQSLNRRLADGQQRVEPRLRDLQKTAEALQEPLMAAQERAAIIQVRRGESANS
jgi:hypothetical protein